MECSSSGCKDVSGLGKLKALRNQFRGLLHDYTHTEARIQEARNQTGQLQTALQVDPLNQQLFASLTTAKQNLEKCLLVEESILKQKSKMHWLQCGDGNNKYFYASLQSKKKANITVLFDEEGAKLTDGLQEVVKDSCHHHSSC